MSQLVKVLGREVELLGWVPKIARLEADGYEFLDEPAPFIESLRGCGVRIDLFTFTQRLPETKPKYGYPLEWDNFAAIPVSTYDHWWNCQIRPEARNRARQAVKKGVVVREVPFDEALVRGIWRIYNETPVRQGRRFPHYGKDFETVYREAATFLDSSFFIGAFLDQSLIAFTKVTADETRTQANMMNILAAVEHRDKAPTNALVARAVGSCADRGIAYLVYHSYTYGEKRDGLVRFKEVNGFQRFDIPRYYVPLTPVGQVSLRLGLHHRFAERIPEPIRSRLRDMRREWYNRKIQGAGASAG